MTVEYGFTAEPKQATQPLFRQVHGTKIVEIGKPEEARQALASPQDADGAFTLSDSVEVYAFSADCMPLLYFDEDARGPIAAVHCGWRGAKQGIARHALDLLSPLARNLHVAIGPCLLGCCFEVRQDFIDEWTRAGKPVERFLERRAEKTFFHFDRYVREVELAELPPGNIHTENLHCTFCSTPRLPSYRRNGGTDPRIRSWIRKAPNRL